MYAPAHFAENDPAALTALIRRRPFAAVLINGADSPVAAHIPLAPQCSENGRIVRLIGHVARANPFWKTAHGAKALAIFSGADAYVSPSYYPSKREHGRVVPTWNYARVEARGTLDVVDDTVGLRAIVETLTDLMEKGRATPWSVGDAPEAYLQAMLKGIVGLSLCVSSLEGVAKLSQNKSAADYEGVRAGLAADGADAVAETMPRRED